MPKRFLLKKTLKINANMLAPVDVGDRVDHCKSGSERLWTLVII